MIPDDPFAFSGGYSSVITAMAGNNWLEWGADISY
jgi:hypothetical protein